MDGGDGHKTGYWTIRMDNTSLEVFDILIGQETGLGTSQWIGDIAEEIWAKPISFRSHRGRTGQDTGHRILRMDRLGAKRQGWTYLVDWGLGIGQD